MVWYIGGYILLVIVATICGCIGHYLEQRKLTIKNVVISGIICSIPVFNIGAIFFMFFSIYDRVKDWRIL